MNLDFTRKIQALDLRFADLMNCREITRDMVKEVPQKGVYVFFERKQPKYVGRTDGMKYMKLQKTTTKTLNLCL